MEQFIILLNGPSSSGKSTLSHILRKLILKKRGDLYEIVSIDDYLNMSSHEAIYEDDVFEISPALLEAASRALRSCGGVIIDHVITSKRIFDQLTDAFHACNMKLIRVTCPREILKTREAARGNRCPGSAEASDAYLFPKDGYDLTVDTHAMSAEECAERIFESIFHEGPEGRSDLINSGS
ncbi:MAG: AAA family ATPase [Oscillospiraceae bacterium]|nr:AAA family ATPase [Oscillospiraceae bacterium]